MKYGLQLYSVRDAAEKDYEMTLREVAAMGYEYVEPAGFFGQLSAVHAHTVWSVWVIRAS